ncbi:MAG: hypothetical protein P4M05_28285 [Bradyrhizobium sp.]|nr:hypothetical protein [Bradyrhizobium sp.]
MLLNHQQLKELSQAARIVRVARCVDLKSAPYRRLRNLMEMPVYQVSVGELARAQQEAARSIIRDLAITSLRAAEAEQALCKLAAELSKIAGDA